MHNHVNYKKQCLLGFYYYDVDMTNLENFNDFIIIKKFWTKTIFLKMGKVNCKTDERYYFAL